MPTGTDLKNAVVYWAIIFIIVAAVVGVGYVIFTVIGFPIQPWMVALLTIVGVAFFGILAIKFLANQLP